MRKVVLYIAMSLDGYVADSDSSVAWLDGDGSDEGNMGTYPQFYESVDTVVLGYKTYQQIVSELSPDVWAYAGKQSYVLTHRELPSTDEITFTKEEPAELIKRLKSEEGGNIWICGGASIASQLIENDLIDSYRISVIPTILGAGIPLFHNNNNNKIELKLISTESNNGIVELNYIRRG